MNRRKGPPLTPEQIKTRRHAYEARYRAEVLKQFNHTPGEAHSKYGALIFSFALRTHAEVGAIMGVTRERVRQIERKAIIKIRRRLQQEWDEFKASQ